MPLVVILIIITIAFCSVPPVAVTPPHKWLTLGSILRSASWLPEVQWLLFVKSVRPVQSLMQELYRGAAVVQVTSFAGKRHKVGQ